MAAAHHNPLAQFEIQPLYHLPTIYGVDLSITNLVLYLLVAVAAITLFYTFAMRKSAMVPGRLQSLAEVTYQFVHDLARENAGDAGLKYFPFIFTIFLFITTMNVLGMIPYTFTPTSHIVITLGLGVLVFVFVVIIGLIKQGPIGFFAHFVPPGLPFWLIPILFVIELVSFLSRPFSLGIRLAANIGAGHTLMKVMAGFVAPLGIILGIVPMAFLIFMTGLEIFVAILQAYVFTLLACLYLGEALATHEHDHFDQEHLSV